MELGLEEKSRESAAQAEKCVFRFNHQKFQAKKEN